MSNKGIGEPVLKMLRFNFNLSHGNVYSIALKKSSLNIFFKPGSQPSQHLSNLLEVYSEYTALPGLGREMLGKP